MCCLHFECRPSFLQCLFDSLTSWQSCLAYRLNDCPFHLRLDLHWLEFLQDSGFGNTRNIAGHRDRSVIGITTDWSSHRIMEDPLDSVAESEVAPSVAQGFDQEKDDSDGNEHQVQPGAHPVNSQPVVSLTPAGIRQFLGRKPRPKPLLRLVCRGCGGSTHDVDVFVSTDWLECFGCKSHMHTALQWETEHITAWLTIANANDNITFTHSCFGYVSFICSRCTSNSSSTVQQSFSFDAKMGSWELQIDSQDERNERAVRATVRLRSRFASHKAFLFDKYSWYDSCYE